MPSADTFSRILDATGFDTEVILLDRMWINAGLARGEELVAALELAAEFPVAYSADLEYPVFRFAKG